MKEGFRRLAVLIRLFSILWAIGFTVTFYFTSSNRMNNAMAPEMLSDQENKEPFDPDKYLAESIEKERASKNNPSTVEEDIPQSALDDSPAPTSVRHSIDKKSSFMRILLDITAIQFLAMILPPMVGFPLAWLIDGFIGNYRKNTHALSN